MYNIDYNVILAAVDFSETSRKAFYTAVGLANRFDASLTIVHVREGIAAQEILDPRDPAGGYTELELGLLRRADELVTEGHLGAERRAGMALWIKSGKPWEGIVKAATEVGADLIVMGTHGHRGFKRFFMGSQCEKVVQHAPCSVLAVKPDEIEEAGDSA